jgi:hypothetical protein
MTISSRSVGQSLLATQLVARINDRCGIDFPLRLAFEQPRISELAVLVEAAGAADAMLPPAIPPMPRKVVSFPIAAEQAE